jgi:hypothetical protein
MLCLRYSSSADPEYIPFLDNLSDFPMNHYLDKAVPPNTSITAAFQYLFEIPSEIIEGAMNLNLSNNNDSQDDYEGDFNLPAGILHQGSSSLTRSARVGSPNSEPPP